MPRVLSIALDDEVYEVLIQEAIRRYGNARSVSRLVNEILRRAFRDKIEEYNRLHGFGGGLKPGVEELGGRARGFRRR